MAIKVGELFVSLGLSTASFAKGINDVTKMTFDSSKSIERSLKIAGNAALAMSAGLVTSLGYLVKRQIDVADAAKKMSEKFGVSVEALTGFSHAAKLSGVDTETLGKGLKNLTKWMVENGQGGRDVKEVLFEVADSYQKMGDGAIRSADAQKKFGRAGAELIPMLKDGRTGLQGMWEEAERLGLVISSKTAEAAEQFNDNLTRLQAILTGVATQIMARNIPTLAGLSRAFVEVSGSAAQAGGEIEDAFINRVLIAMGGLNAAMRNDVEQFKLMAQMLAALASGNTGGVAILGTALATMPSDFEAMLQGAGAVRSMLKEWEEQATKTTMAQKEWVEEVAKKKWAAPFTAQGAEMPHGLAFGQVAGFDKITQKVRENEMAMAEAAVNAKDLQMALTIDPALLAQWSTFTGVFGEIRDAAKQVKPSIFEMRREMEQFSFSGLSAIGDAALGLTSWKNVANQIISDLGRMLWYMLVIKPLMGALTGVFTGGGGGVNLAGISGNASSILTSPMAAGGSFGPRQMLMVGERGPELLFTGNQSGTVIPNGAAAVRAGDQIIHIDARGSDFGTLAKISALIAGAHSQELLRKIQDRQQRMV